MNEYFKLAWRNIWRNKRRTLITIASIFFAIFFALIMRAMQLGSYGHWTDSIVKTYCGYIQVHKAGYWDDPTLDNSFDSNLDLENKIRLVENVSGVIPRFESFALASTGNQTKGVMVVGIDTEKEKQLTNPKTKIVTGSYLDKDSSGVLVSQRLAEFLKLSVNDTVTLLSQGYHGVTAAGIFPVAGIIRLPNPELDRRMIFMSTRNARYLYNAEGRLTSLVINIDKTNKLDRTVDRIKSLFNPNQYEVMSWKDLNPEIVQAIESDQTSGFIMLGLLYLIVGFGVLGTLIMMTTERRREFGVMVALGMQKIKLGLLVTMEMILLGIIGIISGIIGSIPIILYFRQNPIEFADEYAKMFEQYGMEPIMPFVLQIDYFIGQSLVVFLIFLIAIIYPVYSIIRLKEIRALKA
jgi:putative ABC transport system permease protein